MEEGLPLDGDIVTIVLTREMLDCGIDNLQCRFSDIYLDDLGAKIIILDLLRTMFGHQEVHLLCDKK